MSSVDLIAEPDVQRQGLVACRELLQRGDCGSVRYYAEVGSTNTAAQGDISSERPPAVDTLPRLFLTDRQTQGRGRLGRQWLADEGTLTFSLVYPLSTSSAFSHADPAANADGQPQARTLAVPADRVGWIPLATGVAIARTIEYFAAPIHARIKWPNDVSIGGGKVAGVLVEAVGNRPEYVIVGVGLNVDTRLESLAAAIGQPARSLSELAKGPRERYQWLPELVSQINQAFQQLAGDTTDLLTEIRSRCVLTGAAVRYQWGDRVVQGRCLGVDASGSLQVEDHGTVHLLRSGEVTLLK